MINDRDERTKEILELFGQLPRKVQEAVVWLIENFDDIEELLKKPLSPERREQLMEKAKREDDAYLLVLCTVEREFNAHKKRPKK